MKKKLLFNPLANRWNSLVAKYYKLYKRIYSPLFSEKYTEEQQKSLLAKLQSLFFRLTKMQHSVGLKIAGTALAIMLTASISYAQQVWDSTGVIYLKGCVPVMNEHKVWPLPRFADLDKDGDLDLYVGTRDGDIRVCLNNGNNIFAEGVPLLDIAQQAIKVAKRSSPTFADIDGDGDLDLYVGSKDNQLLVYKNVNGTGGFAYDGLFMADGVAIGPVSYIVPQFADIDKDGDLDLYAGDYNGNVEVYKNNGSGVFTSDGLLQADGADVVAANYYSYPAFSDLDKDGDLDLVVGSGRGGGSIKLFTNDAGAFTLSDTLRQSNGKFVDVDYYNGPTFADLDKDGWDELYVGGYWADTHYPNPGPIGDPTKAQAMIWKFVHTSNVGTKPLDSKPTLNIYPNPSSDMINLTGLKNAAIVKIYNSVGVLVYEQRNINKNVNIASLTKGIYFVKIDDGKQVITKKIVKE